MDKLKFDIQDLLHLPLAKRKLEMQLQAILNQCVCMNMKGTIAKGTIRSSPPEESARPAHLPQRQVVFRRHVKVGDAQKTSHWVQVRDRAVNRRVERRDHCNSTKCNQVMLKCALKRVVVTNDLVSQLLVAEYAAITCWLLALCNI